jgi:hypothetical protein
VTRLGAGDGWETGLRLQAAYSGSSLLRGLQTICYPPLLHLVPAEASSWLKWPAHKDDHFHLVLELRKSCKIFQKRRSHILGTRNMTRSNFHAEEPQILDAKVQNLFAPGDLKPRICAPLVKDM